MEHNDTSVLARAPTHTHTHTHNNNKKLKKLSKKIRIPTLSGGILPEKRKYASMVSLASMTPLNTYVSLSVQRRKKKKKLVDAFK